MSLVKCDEEQRWVPTHVQVTVLRARGLRAKGKHGTSDVYTIIQLGKEKYSTCVMEKTTEPEWGEECAFELQPGILEERGRDAYPPGTGDLTLTVMHRALIGLDVFLGEAVIPLDKAFQYRISMKNEWHRLHSKTGKKEKERGELQVTVQFTRHNLTASMYDLSTKDRPRSAFDKLRQRMRAKKRSAEEDSSSAIVAGGYESVVRARGRLPSDGGGEEDYEDDEGGEVRRSKMRSFFLRGKLRKSSDSRSSTSLCSESSESSSRGGSLSPTAGISVVVSDLSNSPSNSSNLTADNSPEHTVAPSPQVSPVRHEMCDFSLPVPHSSENDTLILLPSVCINGNPVETSPLTHHPPSLILQQPQPESTKPVAQSGQSCTQSTDPKSQTSAETRLSKSDSKPKPEPLLPALGVLQKGSSISLSLQNLNPGREEKQRGGPVDGRRWSFDKPGEEEKAAIVAALEYAGRVMDESVMETVIPVGETEIQSKKRRGLFSHRRGESSEKGPITSKEEIEHAQPLVEVKHKGWFSSKDSHSKPSSDHSQSSSSWAGGSTTPDLLRIGNFKVTSRIHQMDGSIDSSISHFEGQTDKDDFEHFAKDRLKSSKETKNSVTPPPLLMKPNKQEPLGDLDGLMVSIVHNTPHVSGSELNHICSNSNKPDQTNPGANVFSEFGLNLSEISLHDNSSLEFSELNAFACPYPALSNNSHYEVNADASHPKECPTMNISTQIPKSSAMLPESEAPLTVSSELSEEVSLETSERPEAIEFAEHIESVKIHKDHMSCCKDSEDTLEPSTLISDSQSKELDLIEPCNFPERDVIPSNMIESIEGLLESNTSLIEGVGMRETTLVVTSEPSESHFLSEQSSPVSTALVMPMKNGDDPNETMDTVYQNEAGGGLLDSVNTRDICSEMEGSVPENLTELPLSPSKNDLTGNLLCSNSGGQEILHSDGRALSLGHFHPTVGFRAGTAEDESIGNSVLSPGSVLVQSLYRSADSNQYLTCVSQQDSISPFLEPVQEVKPNHDQSEEDTSIFGPMPKHVSEHIAMQKYDTSTEAVLEMDCKPNEVIEKNMNPSQEVLSKNESPQVDVQPNNCLIDFLPETHTFTPKSDPLYDNLSKSELIMPGLMLSNEEMLKYNPSEDTPEKYDLPREIISKVDTSEDIIAQLEAQLAPLKTETSLIDNYNRNNSLFVESVWSVSEVNLNLPQLTEPSVCLSDFTLEQTSSITQDLVITDFQLESIFVPQPTETRLLQSPVSYPESAETHKVTEHHPKPANLNGNTEIHITPTVPYSVGPDLFSVNWPPLFQPSPSVPSTFDQPTMDSRHDLSLNFHSSLIDLSPVASSTPHVAVETNALPQLFHLPLIPPTSVESSPCPALAGPLLPEQPLNATLHNSFLQDELQTTNYQSSPHPVKPLTPPDEKRSEGRSVLEKIKSTIHSGRSHHSEQEADKKALVEGGGSYYHLNHSELVNLLIQRDTELKQEREEFEKRGAMLEKGETELKKMKVLIRDLEDYIDTLLVRIIEQTPTLLQVRPKMK
ncbi:uncharacterized protein LOC127660950 isoform X2 [Xyrauchen texanus]|uniref:uncharacterized protein LOC127660950 isoform X2 n=1 Tax=Xyrauchen texanus TaxID=154827 RepID=UPI002241C8B8|nr:uncharacterized protein LOC127660950 isoform X2 [Xyrauchen texanus]